MRSPPYLLSCSLALSLATSAVFGQPVAAPAGEQIIRLPPFIVMEPAVMELKRSDPWLYAELPGLEVLSHCSKTTTHDFTVAYFHALQLIDTLVSPEFRLQSSSPIALLLLPEEDTRRGFNQITATLNAAPQDNPGRSRSFEMLPSLWSDEVDGIAACFVLQQADYSEVNLSLKADFLRFLLEHRTPPLPAWFIEGLTANYANARFNRDDIMFYSALWISRKKSEELRRRPETPVTFLPLQELFDAPPTAETPAGAARRDTWLAEAALFVRWALEPRNPRQALDEFVRRAIAAPVTEADFNACFRLGYSDVRERLADYLRAALNRPLRVRPAIAFTWPRVAVREATPAEIGRIRGDWERRQVAFVKSEFPALIPLYSQTLRQTLDRALENSLDPRLLAVAGMSELEFGNREHGEAFLRQATASDTLRPRAYVELARLLFAKGRARPSGANSPLDPAETAAVLRLLQQARAQLPPLPETYELAAELWHHSTAVPSADDLSFLDEGTRLFPRRSLFILRTAALHAVHGSKARAQELIELGLKSEPSAALVQSFEQLRSVLRQAR